MALRVAEEQSPATQTKFLRRIVGKTTRDNTRNERMEEELEVAPFMEVDEIRQLEGFGLVGRMEEPKDPIKMTEYAPGGRRPRDRPRIS